MYNVRLDNGYFSGSYAKVGKVQGGIDIPTLPPTDDMSKAKFYKYDYHDVQTVTQKPKTEKAIVYDENGKETEITQIVTDENDNVIYEDVITTTSVLDWFFDEEKYAQHLIEKLEIDKQDKINELSEICESIIIGGLDIETAEGIEHFSLEITDQLEIMNQYNNVLKGATKVPYHADNKPCRMYSAEEMTKIALQSTSFITYNRTYFNYIKEAVKRCTTEDEINAITWGVTLPEDLDELFVAITGVSTIAK